jgi:hypothetical protein
MGVGVGFQDKREEKNPWATSLPEPWPNEGLQATADSLRSCVAAAIGGA